MSESNKSTERGGAFDPLVRLGGGEPSVARKVTHSSAWFVGLALVMLGTAAVAGISMFFALKTALAASYTVALSLALLWALLILGLDRFMVLSMEGVTSLGKLILTALPRVLLALAIGIVVSFPITLQIFDKEIREELVKIQKDRFDEIDAEMASSDEKETLDSATAAYEDNEKVLNGDFTISDSPEVAKAKDRVDALAEKKTTQEAERDFAASVELCDREGPRSSFPADVQALCSLKPGKKPPWPERYAELQAKQAALDVTIRELSNADTALSQARASDATAAVAERQRRVKDAQDRRADLQEKVKEAQLAYDARDAALRKANLENTGLLMRSEALSRTADRGAFGDGMRTMHYFVAGMFVAIELAPILMKLLSFKSGGSKYERALGAIQDAETQIMDGQLETDRVVAQGKEATRCRDEDGRRQWEDQIAEKTNREMFEAASVISSQAVAAWAAASAHQLEQFYSGIPGAAAAVSSYPKSPISPTDSIDARGNVGRDYDAS